MFVLIVNLADIDMLTLINDCDKFSRIYGCAGEMIQWGVERILSALSFLSKT